MAENTEAPMQEIVVSELQNIEEESADHHVQTHDITNTVFITTEDGQSAVIAEGQVISEEEVIQALSQEQLVDIKTDEDGQEAKRAFLKDLLDGIYTDIILAQEKQPYLNDVEIHCSDGIFRVPSLLLASMSPLFKIASPMADIVESPSLMLPDVSKNDLEKFFKASCNLFELPLDEDLETIQNIMEILCSPFKGSDDPVDSLFFLAQDWPNDIVNTTSKQQLKPKDENDKENTKPPKKPGRKRGPKPKVKEEPYIKTEVTDSHRTSEVYGLRKVVKRKKFTDEISEPSDLDDDEDIDPLEDSEDEYNPDDNEQLLLEEDDEESESDEEFDDDLGDDEIDSSNENDLLDSEDEIIDASINRTNEGKRDGLPKGVESFTVKLNPNGELEAISAFDNEEDDTKRDPNVKRPRGRPKKKAKIEVSPEELVAIGRVVSVLEDENLEQLAFKSKKIYASVKTNPRSLLKNEEESTVPRSIPLILFCSICEAQFNSQAELKHHCAQAHKGQSKFFVLPKTNPHRDCLCCSALMTSYENLIESENPKDFSQKDICFPCPHCRRRYLGHLGGLTSHLINDHRSSVITDELPKPQEYYQVLKRTDPKVLTCDFCSSVFPTTLALNKHLIACSNNDSGCSAGLFCHICGKMFAQQKYLKDHLARHGKDLTSRPRNYLCPHCPVTCISEMNLQRHIEREHNSTDPDEEFALHENCARCSAMLKSYMENKISKKIPFRDMVFKCPHCCMVLYANHKHAPRYLYNHINKFHTDPAINDFTLGDKNDPNEFRLRSKFENDVLTCEFCGFASKTRANHNVHLSTCKLSTVPCRPGYMCDTCGFIAGTAVHLRNHLETHNDPRTFACDQCDYTGRSKRYLDIHIRNHHTEEGIRKKYETKMFSCPKCGKLKREGPSMKAHVKKCGLVPPNVSCIKCNMEFKRKEDMAAHAVIHYGEIKCTIHNILFFQESEVFQHVNKAEPDEKFPKLECCVCGKTFKHMCIFMKHLRKELGIQPYQCDICKKMVNTYASLQLHMKRLHGNEKMPPREKSYKCDLCPKMFYSRGHLNEHVNGVHNKSSTTVPCPVCHKAFNTMKRMKKHMTNAHKEAAEDYKIAWKHTEPFATIAVELN